MVRTASGCPQNGSDCIWVCAGTVSECPRKGSDCIWVSAEGFGLYLPVRGMVRTVSGCPRNGSDCIWVSAEWFGLSAESFAVCLGVRRMVGLYLGVRRICIWLSAEWFGLYLAVRRLARTVSGCPRNGSDCIWVSAEWFRLCLETFALELKCFDLYYRSLVIQIQILFNGLFFSNLSCFELCVLKL